MDQAYRKALLHPLFRGSFLSMKEYLLIHILSYILCLLISVVQTTVRCTSMYMDHAHYYYIQHI